MINIGKKRFKGKLRDLKAAILRGEISDDQDVDFFIDEPEHGAISKRNPLSGKSASEEIANAARMQEAQDFPEAKGDWTENEMQKLPRGPKSFLDRFLKFAQAAGHEDQTTKWDKAHKFINSPAGKAFQILALLSMLMEGDKGGAEEIMVRAKEDSTNSAAAESEGAKTLTPNEAIEKSAPIWFKRKIQSILKDNMQKRPAGNRLSGELNFKRLYKIKSNARVFQKKEHVNKKQYNVVLLIDCSGSMGGERARVAAICASLITRDFQHLVRLKIKTFNRRDTVVKKFDEKFPAAKMHEPMNRIIQECNSGHGGTNHDWYAVLQGDKDARKEQGEKMVILISDAEPCSGESEEAMLAERNLYPEMGSDGYKMLQAQFLEIHRRGQVRLMSIVVGSQGEGTSGQERMKDLYQKNFSHIGKYSEIYRAVTEVLSAAIKRK